MYKQKTETSGKIAVVGDRELVIGYRLNGIDDTFVVGEDDASKKMQELYSSNEFGLIIASESIRAKLPAKSLPQISVVQQSLTVSYMIFQTSSQTPPLTDHQTAVSCYS